ncbi:hypothetical protein K439DRAFT_327073 [Ramaria rubella]|nr:hypothetical protein K439DRAFT_327073 [Ramaria rubella]
MDSTNFATTIRRIKVMLVFSLITTFCVCTPIFLAAATFALLFVTILLLLMLYVPVRIALSLLDVFLSIVHRFIPERPRILKGSLHPRSRRPGKSLAYAARSMSKDLLLDTIVESRPSPTPSTSNALLLDLGTAQTNTNGSFGSILSPGATDIIFVESPVDFRNISTSIPTMSRLESLSGELVEEVIKHLPTGSISALALVSKRFGTQFRFRRVHSGTEYCPLSTFSLVAQERRLGQYITRITVHPTFYRPPVRMQWLLEGSNTSIADASRSATEDKKHILLGAVLEASSRLQSLTWNEGSLTFRHRIFQMLQTQACLFASLRYLDIPIGSQLLRFMTEPTVSTLLNNTLRLSSLTLRGGLGPEDSTAVIKLFLMASRSIRHLRFVDTQFRDNEEQTQHILDVILKAPSGLQRLELINSRDVDTECIPIVNTRPGFELLIKNDPTTSCARQDDAPLQLKFGLPAYKILINVTSLCFSFGLQMQEGRSTYMITRMQAGVPHLCEVAYACVNLRVFACNIPFLPKGAGYESWPVPVYDSAREQLPKDLLAALILKDKLVSLSLTCWIMTNNQLQVISETLPRLMHFSVLMEGAPVDIVSNSFCVH